MFKKKSSTLLKYNFMRSLALQRDEQHLYLASRVDVEAFMGIPEFDYFT